MIIIWVEYGNVFNQRRMFSLKKVDNLRAREREREEKGSTNSAPYCFLDWNYKEFLKNSCDFLTKSTSCANWIEFLIYDLLMRLFHESCFYESWIRLIFGFLDRNKWLSCHLFVYFDSQTKICFEEIKTSSNLVKKNWDLWKEDSWITNRLLSVITK